MEYGSEGLWGLEGRHAQLVAALADAQLLEQSCLRHIFTTCAVTRLLMGSC